MRKRIIAMLCALAILAALPMTALADRQYLLPTSDREPVSEAELWRWDRESLSFMFNEIFARHGYVFNSGSKFDVYFRAQPWYRPNSNPNNQQAVYPSVTKVEWDNYNTIKKVISQMEASGHPYHSRSLKCVYDELPPSRGWSLTGFEYITVRAGQNWPVYSAPSSRSYRANNRKAMTSTNGAVWAAGWEGDWLLVFYELNKGGLRVGYVSRYDMTSVPSFSRYLSFDYSGAYLTGACTLTDDPLTQSSALARLSSGTYVTYLTTVQNQRGAAFDYIETAVDGQTARGFIPAGNLSGLAVNYPY